VVWLQWVHSPITVVMEGDVKTRVKKLLASMGPQSDNRGYVASAPDLTQANTDLASMGPQSDNRGYGRVAGERGLCQVCRFNGSTVR